jgi:hypothetical protein
VRFHGRRVTKVGPEVKHGLFRVAGRARNPKKLPPEGWGPLNKGCERRTRALPDVSAGGERHDRFGVVVGEEVLEPRIEGRFARRVGAGMHAHPLLPESEMRRMRSMTSSWSMSETMRISREHFGTAAGRSPTPS